MLRSSRRSQLLPWGVAVATFGADNGFDAVGLPTPEVGVSVAVEVRVAVAVQAGVPTLEEGAGIIAAGDDLRGALSVDEGSISRLEDRPTGALREVI